MCASRTLWRSKCAHVSISLPKNFVLELCENSKPLYDERYTGVVHVHVCIVM